MKLIVTTPLSTVVLADAVMHVRAEDESGAFGILPGHGDFLTALSISVVRWRDARGGEHYVAVRGGVLRVDGGTQVIIATPEAVASDDLAELEREVLARFRRDIEAERSARTEIGKLHLAAIREIMRLLRPGERTTGPGDFTPRARARWDSGRAERAPARDP